MLQSNPAPVIGSVRELGWIKTNEVFEKIAYAYEPLKGTRVYRIGPNTLRIVSRYTPQWAMIIGILGLVFFLLGALLFFVTEEKVLMIHGYDTANGMAIQVTGEALPGVATTLEAFLEQYRTIPGLVAA